MELSVRSPAKINWFLHINGLRNDGYHSLQTFYQFIDLWDELQFTVLDTPEIELIHDTKIPIENNLIYKAAKTLQPFAPNKGIRIRLKKNIPLAGGLGGGSSNAGTTLVVLNYLWGLGLTTEALLSLSTKLGADVPIFVYGHASLAEGIGEKLTPYEAREPWVLVVAPDCQVSTQELFMHDELTRTTPRFRIEALKAQDRLKFEPPQFKNDFEPLARKLYTSVALALDWLNQFSQARLSGTGCCVFAPFQNKEEAQKALNQLPETMKGWVVRCLNRSPLLDVVEIRDKPEVALP